MPVFESFRSSGHWRRLDWHRHWLSRLQNSPIAESTQIIHVTFFPVAELCFDVIFYFVEPSLQVSDSLIVRHVSHLMGRLGLLLVKVKPISKSLLRDLIELHIGLGCHSVELLLLLPLLQRITSDLTLRIYELITAKRIWPLDFDDGPLMLVENVILLKSLSFLPRTRSWWCLGNLLRCKCDLLWLRIYFSWRLLGDLLLMVLLRSRRQWPQMIILGE